MDYFEQRNYCAHCGRVDRVHIGRAEPGKRFVFAAHRSLRIGSAGDWRKRLFETDRVIVNEAGVEIGWAAFWKLALDTSGSLHRPSSDGRRWIDAQGHAIRRFT